MNAFTGICNIQGKVAVLPLLEKRMSHAQITTEENKTKTCFCVCVNDKYATKSTADRPVSAEPGAIGTC